MYFYIFLYLKRHGHQHFCMFFLEKLNQYDGGQITFYDHDISAEEIGQMLGGN